MTQRVLDPKKDFYLVRHDLWDAPHGFQRMSEIRKSYDCTHNRSLCVHTANAQHGFRFEEWWYGLGKGNYIVAFGVCTWRATEGEGEVPPKYQHLVGGRPTAIFTSASTVVRGVDGEPVQGDRNHRRFLIRVDGEFCDAYVGKDYEQSPAFWEGARSHV